MPEHTPTLPNIIVILTDDQGHWALGCADNPEIHTPHVDWLARHGTRFDNFFCTSPVCSPARATILTGKIPSQHGVMDWIRDGNLAPRAIQYLEGHQAYTDFLVERGYVCGLSGKWHLGDSATPQKGFTHWFAHQKGGSPYRGAPMVTDGKLVNLDNEYLTEAITNDALGFLEKHIQGGRPWYLSIHYTAPHAPWINQHPQKWVDYYRDCPFTACPQEPKHPWRLESTEPTVTPENVRAHLQGYYAAVSAMDEQIGRVLQFLTDQGQIDNTLIVFMGDNGFNCGHHGIWGKGNGTFPANMYDTSLKVPAVFFHQGRIRAGQVSKELVSGYDFMPTLLDYLGIENPGAAALPGRSFVPILRANGGIEERPIVVWGEYGPTRMVRSTRWKYVHRYPLGPHELYDLERDPHERENLVEKTEHQGTIESLRHYLHEWFLRYSDPDIDGTKQPVRGKGQVDKVGRASQGRLAFHQDMEEGKYFLG